MTHRDTGLFYEIKPKNCLLDHPLEVNKITRVYCGSEAALESYSAYQGERKDIIPPNQQEGVIWKSYTCPSSENLNSSCIEVPIETFPPTKEAIKTIDGTTLIGYTLMLGIVLCLLAAGFLRRTR